MTTYIIWNIIDDAAFRPRYLEVTGEAIQTDPIQSAGGMQYMIGSSRVTAEHLEVLQNEFSLSTDPTTFVLKDKEEE